MSKIDRRIQRARDRMSNLRQHGLTAPEGPVRKFDLSGIELTDISNVELDTADNSIEVTVQLPVGDNEGYANFEETIDLDDVELPYLEDAALKFMQAVRKAVAERAIKQAPFPCASCTGACCGKQLTDLGLTRQDVERLEAAGLSEHYEIYDREEFSGRVGIILLLEDEKTGGTVCPFLRDWGCSIYEIRPLICREFSAWQCEIHDPDPEKIEGRVNFGKPDEPKGGK